MNGDGCGFVGVSWYDKAVSKGWTESLEEKATPRNGTPPGGMGGKPSGTDECIHLTTAYFIRPISTYIMFYGRRRRTAESHFSRHFDIGRGPRYAHPGAEAAKASCPTRHIVPKT